MREWLVRLLQAIDRSVLPLYVVDRVLAWGAVITLLLIAWGFASGEIPARLIFSPQVSRPRDKLVAILVVAFLVWLASHVLPERYRPFPREFAGVSLRKSSQIAVLSFLLTAVILVIAWVSSMYRQYQAEKTRFMVICTSQYSQEHCDWRWRLGKLD